MHLPLYDSWNMFRKMTPLRLLNLVQITLSFYYSKLFKTPQIAGLPTSLTIEPTTACNLGCPECPSGLKQFSRPEGNLKKVAYKNIIDQVYRRSFYLNFYFQGEPFINPNFLDMIAYAHQKKMYTSTSTNAHFLTDDVAKKTVLSGLSRLTISIDGTTQETYEQYRKKGELSKVLQGTKNIIKWKKELNVNTPHVIFQFLVVKPNQHQIEDAKVLAKEMGVNEIRFKTAQVYDFKHGNPLIPTIEKYSRYIQQQDGTYRLKNKLLNECWRMWSSCVVTWDGKIVPCCFDKDAKHRLGDLSSQPFKHVWRSAAYNNFRKGILTNRASIDICKNCVEGTKVFD